MHHFGKNFRKMKGAESVATVLGAIFITVIVVFFFYYIFPLFFGDLFQSIALSSSEIVARDIAGFISVSGVAPDEISIQYSPSSSVFYNVSVSQRVVKINSASVRANTNEVASEKSAVDNLNENIILANIFDISKNIKLVTNQNGNKNPAQVYSITGKSSQTVTCANMGGTCRSVCFNNENDAGTLNCPQSGAGGGATCCTR